MAPHWTDLPPHVTHFFGNDGHCLGCMMHKTWPGARDVCSEPHKPKPRKPRPLPTVAEVQIRISRIVKFQKR